MSAHIICIDDFKEKIKGYSPEKAADFHIQSAKMADSEFDQVIKESNYNKLILLGGGSASGKTEYLHTYLEEERAVIFDSTLSGTTGAKIKVKKAARKDMQIELHYILPDNLKRAFVAFLGRARKLNPETFHNTHSGSRKTLLWITDNFPDILIKIIESYYIKDKLKYRQLSFKNRSARKGFIKSIQRDINEITKELE